MPFEPSFQLWLRTVISYMKTVIQGSRFKVKLCLVVVLLQALWFLCGFMANLPTAFSLSCYSCQDYPGSTQPCSNPSEHHCLIYYDSCMSADTTIEYNGERFTSTVKGCTISQVCNSNLICEQLNITMAAVNMRIGTCSVSCCHGDLCNGQSGGGTCFVLPYTPFVTFTFSFHFPFPFLYLCLPLTSFYFPFDAFFSCCFLPFPPFFLL